MLSPREQSQGPREYLLAPGHRGVGLSAGGFVVFWSFPVWHVPLRVLLFTLQPSEYHPPYCLFWCATTPEEWGTQRNTVASQMKMSSAQVHIKPVLLVKEFRSCCVLNNTFCIDLFASSFTSTSIVLNSHRAIHLHFLNNKTLHRDRLKYRYLPKGGDIGFPNAVIHQTKALRPSSSVRVPLCLTRLFSSFGVQIIY